MQVEGVLGFSGGRCGGRWCGAPTTGGWRAPSVKLLPPAGHTLPGPLPPSHPLPFGHKQGEGLFKVRHPQHRTVASRLLPVCPSVQAGQCLGLSDLDPGIQTPPGPPSPRNLLHCVWSAAGLGPVWLPCAPQKVPAFPRSGRVPGVSLSGNLGLCGGAPSLVRGTWVLPGRGDRGAAHRQAAGAPRVLWPELRQVGGDCPGALWQDRAGSLPSHAATGAPEPPADALRFRACGHAEERVWSWRTGSNRTFRRLG